MTPLTPRRLAGLTFAEVGALRLQAGNRRRRVDDLFELSGAPLAADAAAARAPVLTIAAATSRLHRVGAAMDGGRLALLGSVGAHCGLAMSGGVLTVAGDCGDYAGAAMSGGALTVNGDAGICAGGAPAGERFGMQGGLVHVRGSVAARAGERLRRGLLLIEGDAGDALAARMIAGTILVFGRAGADVGLQMRRGTVWLARSPAAPLAATFNPNGVQSLGFLALLGARLRDLDGRFDAAALSAPARRWLGDRACDGRGEILLAGG